MEYVMPEITTLAHALEYLTQHQDPPVSVAPAPGGGWLVAVGISLPLVVQIDDAGLLGAARDLAGMSSWENFVDE